jgi:hypothetical protein
MSKYHNNNSLLYDKKTFKELDPLMRMDKEFVKKCLKRNGLLYECLDKKLKNDKEILLIAFEQDEDVWDFIMTEFYNDFDLMFQLVKIRPLVLLRFPIELKQNPTLVEYVINYVGVDALWGMPIEIFQNVSLMVKALQSEFDQESWEPILSGAGYDAEYSIKIIKAAMSIYGDAIANLHYQDLLKDPAVLNKSMSISI